MQWKEMDWPILIDPLNLMEVTAVPLTFLIDEYGVIRYSRPSDEEFEEFLNRTYERPSGSASSTETAASDLVQLAKSAQTGSLEAKRRYAEALVLWGSDALTRKAIETYEKALQFDPGSGPDHFRLGVAYRKRYDSSERREGDFARAVKHWRRALDIDPNQYIWRRRIQQYGPRLNKPYSFYDWVRQARQELTARGENPPPAFRGAGRRRVCLSGEGFQDFRGEGRAGFQGAHPPRREGFHPGGNDRGSLHGVLG